MRTVVICGMTLIASSIAETLRKRPCLRVLQLEATPADAVRGMRGVLPDAVVIDMSSAPRGLLVVLLRKYPGVLVIGADAGSNELVVLSGHPVHPLTTDNLVQLIEAGGSAGRRSGQESDKEEPTT